MLTRAQKEEQVADLKERFGRASCVYVADYRGLDVESANDLRRKIRAAGAGDFEYRVMKNSVLRLAAGNTPVEEIASHFQGPTAIALSMQPGAFIRLPRLVFPDATKTGIPRSAKASIAAA